MSGNDMPILPNKLGGTCGVARPSKLPLFGRRSCEKQPPRSLVDATLTNSPHDRIRPSTVVKPYLSAQNTSTINNEAQRWRYSASQPNTPVRSSQSETDRELQQRHRFERKSNIALNPFLLPGAMSGSATPKESGINCAIPQSASLSSSRTGFSSHSHPKPKPYRMENMSVEHLQYLEQRLLQLLDVVPSRPVPFTKAKSDSGRQTTNPLWMSETHPNHHQALHYPVVTAPFPYHPHATPLLIFAPPPTPQLPFPPQVLRLQSSRPTISGPEFIDPDPYSRCSSAFSVSSSYAGTPPSSMQSFNKDELHCLLNAVRNMLSMHQQCQTSSTTKSSSNLDPLAVLQQRPFSWYLHHTAAPTTPSSPTSSTVNLFLDENYSMNAEITDDGGALGIDDVDGKEERRRNSFVSDESPHPPLLPAGFRNFSRYLDSKFGPDSAEGQRGHHHHHQRRRRHEFIVNDITNPAVTTTSTVRVNRDRSVTDARPKISITTCSGDTGFYSDLPLSPRESPRQTPSPAPIAVDGNKFTQPLKSTWCAPYWCPPPPPIPLPPLPLPPPSPQVRYFAAPPPPNAAAACWFRAAANHFATAAAIFAADNAAAASSISTPNEPPMSIRHSTEAAYVNRTRECREHPAPSPFTMYPQNIPSVSSSSQNPTLYPPVHISTEVNEGNLNHNREVEEGDESFAFSDEEDQRHSCRRQRRLPAVEPIQRQLWGRLGNDMDSPLGGAQTTVDTDCGLDMLPQDPALILPDQVAFYAQIKDLLDLDINTSLPLPPGWAVGVSSSGRRFYVSGAGNDSGSTSCRNRARITTWRHPVIAPRIPLGWERVEMRRGNFVYYRHLLIPHTQRHHPDLWFPTSLKNLEFEQQSWFLDLRKLQESVSNFDKGNSQLIESYANTRDINERSRFTALFQQYSVGELETLLKHLDCRFFRDLHRIIVTFEVARIRIVRELFVQHIYRTTASTASSSPSVGD